MLKRIRHRLGGDNEHGYSMIELLIVIIIIGILLAIAVPSYLGFRERVANNAAQSNLRAALPATDAYHGDKGTYVGMDFADLTAIDSGVSSTLTVASATKGSFCLTDTVSGKTWSVRGPNPSSSDYYASADCT